MVVTVSISLGDDHGGVTIELGDEEAWNPTVITDALDKAVPAALKVAAERDHAWEAVTP